MNIRIATSKDLFRLLFIQHKAFSSSEACSVKKMKKRIESFSESSYVIEEKQVIGYLISFFTSEDKITDSLFERSRSSKSEGEFVILLTLAIDREYQHQNYGTFLLEHFIKEMKKKNKKKIFLLCKKEKMTFYFRFGFQKLKEVTPSHVSETWQVLELML